MTVFTNVMLSAASSAAMSERSEGARCVQVTICPCARRGGHGRGRGDRVAGQRDALRHEVGRGLVQGRAAGTAVKRGSRVCRAVFRTPRTPVFPPAPR